MGEIIATASQKGGVGKTTTAVNLSASLAILEKKVLLIDTDPQGSVGDSFGMDKYTIDYGMYEVLVKNVPIVDAIVETRLNGFDIVPANIWGEAEEIAFTQKLENTQLLRSVLDVIKDDYDYIIIDCPPSLGTITINSIVSADSVLIPIQCEYFALKALGRFLKMTREIKSKYNPSLSYRGFLLTMVDEKDSQTNAIINELKRSLKDLVFKSYIPRDTKVSEAPAHGYPVALLDVGTRGAVAYLELAKEIIK